MMMAMSAFAAAEERIKLNFNGETAVVKMFDNAASQEFMAQLPMTLTFEDYASNEKIAYLPKKLTQGLRNGGNGDFTYYSPWGNLAIFYKGMGVSTVVHLGVIESGKDKLAAQRGKFTVQIEKVG